MAVSQTKLNEEIRQRVMVGIIETTNANGEDVQRIASNKIAYPTLDSQGNEKWVVLTVTVPTSEDFDGYGEAESYEMKLKAKAEKKAEAEAKKKAKIEADKKRRQKLKEIHDKGEQ